MSKATKTKGLNINSISPKTNVFLSILMIIGCICIIAPLLLVVSISLSSQQSIDANGYQFWPSEFSAQAYTYLFKVGGTMWWSYGMTVFYTVFGTVTSLFVMSMFAYALSRKALKGRRFLAFFNYFTALFGGGLVPAYLLITKYLNIDNTIWVFILPGLVSPFYVLMLRAFMQSSIPESILESAKLDGANEFHIFFRIVLPLSKAGLATIGLFTVVNKWNDWFTGVLYIQDKKLQPIMTLLQNLQNNIEYLKAGSAASATAQGMQMLKEMPTESTRMAITIIAILPLLIAYPFFQKYFVKGLTVGSVKG